MEKLQIDFTMPNGYVRHLLFAFTPDNIATDGYDYGYDALNIDTFPDDLNWMIDDKRYVIQGVGAFNEESAYPLGMFLQNSGTIKIELKGTYNFSNTRDVYIYDSQTQTYTDLNSGTYVKEMINGEYPDRFYLAFKDNSDSAITAKNSLSVEDNIFSNTQIKYLNSSKELFIDSHDIVIQSIKLYNINGQQIIQKQVNEVAKIKIPLQGITSGFNIVSLETEKGIFSEKIWIH